MTGTASSCLQDFPVSVCAAIAGERTAVATEALYDATTNLVVAQYCAVAVAIVVAIFAFGAYLAARSQAISTRKQLETIRDNSAAIVKLTNLKIEQVADPRPAIEISVCNPGGGTARDIVFAVTIIRRFLSGEQLEYICSGEAKFPDFRQYHDSAEFLLKDECRTTFIKPEADNWGAYAASMGQTVVVGVGVSIKWLDQFGEKNEAREFWFNEDKWVQRSKRMFIGFYQHERGSKVAQLSKDIPDVERIMENINSNVDFAFSGILR